MKVLARALAVVVVLGAIVAYGIIFTPPVAQPFLPDRDSQACERASLLAESYLNSVWFGYPERNSDAKWDDAVDLTIKFYDVRYKACHSVK